MKQLFVFLLLVTSTLSAASFAGTFSGIISRSHYRLELLTRDKSFKLIAADSFVGKDLLKLKSGDYLQGWGMVDGESSIIRVHSVDVVGLRKIIGEWVADDSTVLDITNFRQLQVFFPSEVTPMRYERPLKLNYSLSPEEGTSWTILLNDNRYVQTGSVEIDTDELVLSIRGSNNQPERIIFHRRR